MSDKEEKLSSREEEMLKMQGSVIAGKYQQHLVPVNSIKHYQYYCIIVKGSQIYASGGHPLFFHKDTFKFCKDIALEEQGSIERADKVYTRAQKSKVFFSQVITVLPRKKKMFSKRELMKRKSDAFKESISNIPKESTPPDMEVPSVQGGEHQSVSGEQTNNVHELHSNNNTQQNKGD